MKFLQVISLIICIVLINSKAEEVKQASLNSDNQIGTSTLLPVDVTPKHISEVFYGGNPNTLPLDRSPLWKNYQQN